MGLRSMIERIGARIGASLRRGRPVVVERRAIPRVELWELWEGADDDGVLEVLEGIRRDVESDAEEMQEAYRQPN